MKCHHLKGLEFSTSTVFTVLLHFKKYIALFSIKTVIFNLPKLIEYIERKDQSLSLPSLSLGLQK